MIRSPRMLIWNWMLRLQFLKRPAVRYCADNSLVPSLLTRTTSANLRSLFNLPPYRNETQLNQDIFALITNRFRSGFFIEIGANDGFTLSNTAYLEEHFGWRGVLVEPNPIYATSLAQRKNSLAVMKAISASTGSAEFVDAGLYGGISSLLDNSHRQHTVLAQRITVDTISFQELLDETQAPSRINFISIDVEGGELEIVGQMAACDRRFTCGCIEHNSRKRDYDQIEQLLKNADYRIVWANQTRHDLFFVDNQMRNFGPTIEK